MPDESVIANVQRSSAVGLSRDRRRALAAHRAVKAIAGEAREDFKIAVHAFGAEILQNGLAAAMEGLKRKEEVAADGRAPPPHPLLVYLADLNIPGLGNTARDAAQSARTIDARPYVVATRETLRAIDCLVHTVNATRQGSAENA